MLLTAALLASLGRLVAVTPEQTGPTPVLSEKKARFLALKGQEFDRLSPEAGDLAATVIQAEFWRTRERTVLAGVEVQPEILREFLRCWFTDERAEIPEELIAVVVDAARHFDARQVRIISAFRHRKYNKLLRKKGREVALNSHHTRGQAIDFKLPGVGTRRLYRYLRSTHKGGVGFYPHSGFVHVDLGRRRTWRGH